MSGRRGTRLSGAVTARDTEDVGADPRSFEPVAVEPAGVSAGDDRPERDGAVDRRGIGKSGAGTQSGGDDRAGGIGAGGLRAAVRGDGKPAGQCVEIYVEAATRDDRIWLR